MDEIFSRRPNLHRVPRVRITEKNKHCYIDHSFYHYFVYEDYLHGMKPYLFIAKLSSS